MIPTPHPSVKHRVTLAVDIDETLVHATVLRPGDKAPSKFDFKVRVRTAGVDEEVIFVHYRPNVSKFLQFLSEKFEVVVFTASQRCYADPVMDALDPQGRLGRLRLYREHCADLGGTKVKDLSLLGRPIHRVALLDNLPSSYMFQPRNGLPVASWYGDSRDDELMRLVPALQQLAACTDVSHVLDHLHE
jgi:RNA polymerase II subunit A small phosphatase-like protein